MTSTAPISTPHEAPVLPATLRLGAAHLVVSDLPRALAFYEHALGLHVQAVDGHTVTLGDGTEAVLVLHEEKGARPGGRHAGLYHVALLYPSRAELARAGQRLAATRTQIQGASDHHTHEAFYLGDPDGNGLELAADRPRDAWPEMRGSDGYGGSMRPAPLDVADLLAVVDGEPLAEKVEEGLRVGHLHLHVGDIDRGLAFYRDVLGFEEQANLGTASFVSAGGYHHHLGFNVWQGEGVGPAPPGSVGLEHWTVLLADRAEVDAVRERVLAAGLPAEPVAGDDAGFLVRDPWGTALVITTAPNG